MSISRDAHPWAELSIADLSAALVGRRVSAVEEIDNDPDGYGWCEHESYRLTFDDGTVAEFKGWGHDAWGADVRLGSLEP